MSEKIKNYIQNLTKNQETIPLVNEIDHLFNLKELSKVNKDLPINAFIALIHYNNTPLFYKGLGCYGHEFGMNDPLIININNLSDFISSLPCELQKLISIEFVHCNDECDIDNIKLRDELLGKFAGRYYPMNIVTGNEGL